MVVAGGACKEALALALSTSSREPSNACIRRRKGVTYTPCDGVRGEGGGEGGGGGGGGAVGWG